MENPTIRTQDLGPKGILEVQYSVIGNVVSRSSITINGEQVAYDIDFPESLDEISAQDLGVQATNPIDHDFAAIVNFFTTEE
ncbi:MAG: hypothetical protein JWP97_6838 [Labilithrix sp.]|nr:hypothetical protein [Labilithrix sp.]